MNFYLLLVILTFLFFETPFIKPVIFPTEKEGFLLVEAESYKKQELNTIRSWKVIDTSEADQKQALSSASGNSYLQLLPDTRQSHDDKLIKGENFINEPGKMAVLSYPVKIKNPGRYYVWVKAFSTNTEDNGIHVGIDGLWPESGQRMQWCEGKKQWTWGSKQRTEANHCGEEKLIYLDISKPGKHVITFSMREDGFAFDQWAITTEYRQPD
jgi:hypothetical protein